jgi:hypothetical protein
MPGLSYNVPLLPDIWHSVTHFLDRADLSKLSVTSSYFLEFFRPILYRHLTLNFHDRCTKSTLILLSTHSALARYVTSFTINTPEKSRRDRRDYQGMQDLLIAAIGKMTHLHTIRMLGSVFASVTEERLFLKRLRECHIPVCDFAFIASYPPNLEGKELSENGLVLSNLTTLLWDISWNTKKESRLGLNCTEPLESNFSFYSDQIHGSNMEYS